MDGGRWQRGKQVGARPAGLALPVPGVEQDPTVGPAGGLDQCPGVGESRHAGPWEELERHADAACGGPVAQVAKAPSGSSGIGQHRIEADRHHLLRTDSLGHLEGEVGIRAGVSRTRGPADGRLDDVHRQSPGSSRLAEGGWIGVERQDVERPDGHAAAAGCGSRVEGGHHLVGARRHRIGRQGGQAERQFAGRGHVPGTADRQPPNPRAGVTASAAAPVGRAPRGAGRRPPSVPRSAGRRPTGSWGRR